MTHHKPTATRHISPYFIGICAVSLAIFTLTTPVFADNHGISMYGKPALPANYTALPYANPDAPKGGQIVFGESGGFDSLNPYILKGRSPWGVRAHMVESLMGRNWDEPFALYGLLAESIKTADDRSWVEFTLRPEAQFSDGSPVTVDDVLWSFETMGAIGHPRYQRSWQNVASATQTGERTLRIVFKEQDLEAPLIMGLRPVLKKSDWDGRAFDESGLDPFTASGAYILDEFEPNRFIQFRRNPDYWGRDLAFNRGRNNFDTIRYEYFGDGGVVFEAFKAGTTSVHREWNGAKWNSSYDFPAVQSGAVVKSLIPHQRPTGINGFVMNTRRDIFKDWRVRDAMIHAFNYEFINQTVNDSAIARISSYFSNSVLGMREGAATGKVRALLSKFDSNGDLIDGAMDGYTLPVSDGNVRNRGNLRIATARLAEAGWTIQDGALKNSAGDVFAFDIVLSAGSTEDEAIANIYADALRRLGMDARVITVDSAQYKERVTVYDFDMTKYRRGLSLSPGVEQKAYWGGSGVVEPGSRNYMGVDNAAINALVDGLVLAESQEDFVATVRALDRVLMAGRYVIPIWPAPALQSRVAHKRELHYPAELPIYGDWIGFMPDVWWDE
ncbi:MAG: extracellular solute-binding protein [Candidatus Halichondribacter symbioticus]